MRLRVILMSKAVVDCTLLSTNTAVIAGSTVQDEPGTLFDVAGIDSNGQMYHWYANEIFAIELVAQ